MHRFVRIVFACSHSNQQMEVVCHDGIADGFDKKEGGIAFDNIEEFLFFLVVE